MIIKNFKRLATSRERKLALLIAEAGLQAIKTDNVIRKNVKLSYNTLKINGKNYNLNKYKRIFVIGAGKASYSTAKEIEKILGKKITNGVVIDISPGKLKRIKVVRGDHPVTSKKNLIATKKMIDVVSNLNKEDIVICLISGGASALLSYPAIPLSEMIRLNKRLLKCGADIKEMNSVRKHVSRVKGGNLAKIVYPAKLVSIIFSDVVGNDLSTIASGPTVKDNTSVNDAEKIIRKYKLGSVRLFETPKNTKYFRNVDNLLLLSNKVAVDAMAEKARRLGLDAMKYSTSIHGEARLVGKKIAGMVRLRTAFIAAGETTVTVRGHGGKGGRNQELVLSAIEHAKGTMIAIGSDGMDNTDAAGAIIDRNSAKKAARLKLNTKDYLKNNDSYHFFKKMRDLIFTGPTGSNVSDLIVYIKVS